MAPVKKNPEDTTFPGIETLQSVHKAYRELQSGARNLSEAAAAIGIDKTVLHRRIQRFERAIEVRTGQRVRIFERRRGARTRAIDDGRVIQLMADVAETVQAYDRVSANYLRFFTVSCATSLTAANFLFPRMIEYFRNEHVAFELRHGKPRRLRGIAGRGEADFVLLAVPEDYDVTGESVSMHVDLPMALICPRGHWTETETIPEEFPWKKLVARDVMILLAEEHERYPMPQYPSLPEDLRVHRVGSTALSHTIVAEGKDHRHSPVTISLPQFFSSIQREKVHIVYREEFGKVRLALLRADKNSYVKKTRHFSDTKCAQLDRVEEFLKKELTQLTRHESLQTAKNLHIYHITRASEPVWLCGTVTWRTDGESVTGYVKTMAPRSKDEEKPLVYYLRGRKSGAPGSVRLICRAFAAEQSDDEFVLSGVESGLSDNLFVGLWCGQTSWETSGERRQFVGSFVISSEMLSITQLNKLAANYLVEYGIENVVSHATTLQP